MKILVLNSGSSSLKYKIIDMENENILAKGLIGKIGLDGSHIIHIKENKKYSEDKDIKCHKDALKEALRLLTDKDFGCINSVEEIDAIGHRVVHGGEFFHKSVLIDSDVIEKLEELFELAPLHNPANVAGMISCKELLPDIKMVAVFDTSFHQTLPKRNYIYSLPYEVYTKYKIRKYGFHGTSHRYVSMECAKYMKKDIKDLNIISIHLGNGASLCAIEKGISINTSMGFTPLAGIPMGTRTGDIDPAIIPFLMDKENIDHNQIDIMLNKKSGLLGVSGVSSDLRDVLKVKDENERASLSIDVYTARVREFIGAYYVDLSCKLDAIVFTAGVGENSPLFRKMACEGMQNLGINIDDSKNNITDYEGVLEISASDSPVKVFAIRTDEELLIARDTMQIVK